MSHPAMQLSKVRHICGNFFVNGHVGQLVIAYYVTTYMLARTMCLWQVCDGQVLSDEVSYDGGKGEMHM